MPTSIPSCMHACTVRARPCTSLSGSLPPPRPAPTPPARARARRRIASPRRSSRMSALAEPSCARVCVCARSVLACTALHGCGSGACRRRSDGAHGRQLAPQDSPSSPLSLSLSLARRSTPQPLSVLAFVPSHSSLLIAHFSVLFIILVLFYFFPFRFVFMFRFVLLFRSVFMFRSIALSRSIFCPALFDQPSHARGPQVLPGSIPSCIHACMYGVAPLSSSLLVQLPLVRPRPRASHDRVTAHRAC